MTSRISLPRLAVSALTLAVVLSACHRAQEPAAKSATATDAPEIQTDGGSAPQPTQDQTPGPQSDVTPAPAEGPANTPAPEAQDALLAAQEPALASMRDARPPSKLSVPVDLKYSFGADPLQNQEVTLHLAAVPRVAVSNLTVSLKNVPGVRISSGNTLNVQKAGMNGTYRQQYSLVREANGPNELRVLVTVDMPQGLGHGFFSIPLESGTASQKQDSVKLH